MHALVIVFVQYCSAAYKEAGGVASEALSGIRTVTALSGQEKEISRYSKLLVGLGHSLYRRSRSLVLMSCPTTCPDTGSGQAIWHQVWLCDRIQRWPGCIHILRVVHSVSVVRCLACATRHHQLVVSAVCLCCVMYPSYRSSTSPHARMLTPCAGLATPGSRERCSVSSTQC